MLPNQLQHLAPQMWDFSRPSLYGGLEDRLVERFTTTRDYSGKPPGKPTYDSIDVGQYLQDNAADARGLFLLHLRAMRLAAPAPARTATRSDDRGDASIEDTRLILVTDLGFIVKQAKDGSRDVFVQSIRSGLPVAGARVELVGGNGQPVLAATTDATGRAQLPAPPIELRAREDAAADPRSRRTRDMSFLPFRTERPRARPLALRHRRRRERRRRRSSCRPTCSRIAASIAPARRRTSGVITRTADWKASLAGLPLDVEITDPRGLIVSRSAAEAVGRVVRRGHLHEPGRRRRPAPIRRWPISSKDERRRETLGSTSFRVQEFEPDRMKVQLDLSRRSRSTAGCRPDDVKARVTRRASVRRAGGQPARRRRAEPDAGAAAVRAVPGLPLPDRRSADRSRTRKRSPAPSTDDKGNAEFNLDLKRFVGRAYRLNVLGRAFEAEGGRNVAAQNSAIVSDAPYLVGVKPDGDLAFVQRGERARGALAGRESATDAGRGRRADARMGAAQVRLGPDPAEQRHASSTSRG